MTAADTRESNKSRDPFTVRLRDLFFIRHAYLTTCRSDDVSYEMTFESMNNDCHRPTRLNQYYENSSHTK